MKKTIILMFVITIFAAVGLTMPQTSRASAKVNFAKQQEKPLTEEEVGALLDALKEDLPQLIDDEEAVAEITGKWDEREGLPGKTASQILQLLFADVRSVVNDKETLDAVWAKWHEDDDEEVVAARPPAQPTRPAATPARPAGPPSVPAGTEGREDAEGVAAILDELEEELPDFLDDEAQISAISKRWRARRDLIGKTETQIKALLFADVKSVVKDADTLLDIQDSWMVSDAIISPSATKEQQQLMAQLKKAVFEEAEKNMDTWKQVFLMLQLGGAAEYDPEAVAGFYLMREGATPAEAWVKALEGIVAFQKLQNRNLLPAEIEQMKEMTVKLIGCGSNCDAQHKKLKERAVEIIQAFRRAGMMITFIIQLTDKQNMESFLKSFIQEAYKEYQGMEFYDPYKIEAECRKNGGDELGCVKSTYFGLFGYGLFGKQADEKVHIDQKSLDLVNRWKEERFKKFQCINGDCKKGIELKPKP